MNTASEPGGSTVGRGLRTPPVSDVFRRGPQTPPYKGPQRRGRLKLVLFLNYFVFAILLNSVGTVILQVQRSFGVSATAASVLEACKDLSIVVASFTIAAYVARFGYKRAMLAALVVVGAACAAMPMLGTFLMTKLLFVLVGLSFGAVKVSVFATLGVITHDRREHLSLMSFLESFFMVGILSGFLLFSLFVDDTRPGSTSWFRVYYVVGALALVTFALLWGTPVDESAIDRNATGTSGFGPMLTLALRPLVLVFMMGAFIYVLTEQGIMSWLPTFNNQVLHLPAALSIQMAAILAAATALGRFAAGWVLRRFSWFSVLACCLLAAAALVLVAMPLAQNTGIAFPVRGWGDAPLAAFVFPLIGFFLAPIYPAINSVILSSLPQAQHGAMSGLIVIFSALGGTTGSLLSGRAFETWGGLRAFHLSLVPLLALIACLALLKHLQKSPSTALPSASSAA